MNHELGSYEEAEVCVRKALEIEPKKDAVIHTFAEIARRKALKDASIVRRQVYRRQAVERLADLSNPKSVFADYTRCKIRLDELNEIVKNADLNESDDILSELEDANRSARVAIDNALNRHSEDPEILTLDAEWHRLMKDAPAAKRALTNAWAKGAKNPRLALQLAKLHRNSDQAAEELEYLQQAIDRSSDDTAVNMAMAKALIRREEFYEQAALYFSRSYRLTDRNYEARYLHAQYLFSLGEGDKAADLFDQVDEIAPSNFKQKWEIDVTSIAKRIGVIDGRIDRMESTFLFLQSSRYPRDIYGSYYQSNDSDWNNIQNQSAVKFEVGFSRLGPVAIKVHL